LAVEMNMSGIFPLIGATANCSSYQNPRRKKNLSNLGKFIVLILFKTGTGALLALVKRVCCFACFI